MYFDYVDFFNNSCQEMDQVILSYFVADIDRYLVCQKLIFKLF